MENYEISHSTGTKKEIVFFFVINTFIAILLYHFLPDYKQIIAGTVFLALVIGTLVFWRFRVAVAFLGMVVLLLTGTIDLPHMMEYMSLDVILFLIGMMLIVALLRRAGFFRSFLSIALELTGFRPGLLLSMIVILSAIMAALVDEVTSILFTATLVLDFCQFFKVNPLKPLISVVFATNIGSSWTVLGNPIGILIALRSGLTFEDFLSTAFPVGVLALSSIVIVTMLWMKTDLKVFKRRIKSVSQKERRKFLDSLEKIDNKKKFFGSMIIFFGVILLLANHHRLELLLGLASNTMLVGASLLGAGVAMLWQRSEAREVLMKDVDWWTLTFFMFLFAKAGALKYVGLTEVISEAIITFTGNENVELLIVIVLWVSGIASAAADNVVVVATLIPVLQDLTTYTGSDLLWWALLFGGCYGGNMTMVGSTANIIALGFLEERAHVRMSLWRWMKIGIAGAVIPMLIGTLYLIVLAG